MMTANRLMNYVAAEPFRLFRIKMTGGETFEIRHPEMVQVGRTTATIFTWMNDDIEEPKEREREISILLIESIEPLRPTASTGHSQHVPE
jgi:hypothetical protein